MLYLIHIHLKHHHQEGRLCTRDQEVGLIHYQYHLLNMVLITSDREVGVEEDACIHFPSIRFPEQIFQDQLMWEHLNMVDQDRDIGVSK